MIKKKPCFHTTPLEVSVCVDKLEAKLAQVPEWAAASPWHLRVTAESSGTKATKDYSGEKHYEQN